MKTTDKTFSLVGILNVTPDSFYDGGKYQGSDQALRHAGELVCAGADIIDVGGASSRPGAQPLQCEEECNRVVPVVELLVKKHPVPVSVDTTSSFVARSVLEAGATWINDISAGRHDPEMVKVIADYRCKIVLMHSRGTPQTMMQHTTYSSLVEEVVCELSKAVDIFRAGGVEDEQIVLDPGIGFAKTPDQNRELLGRIEAVVGMGYPVMLGTSRKTFVGTITGRDADDRLYGTLGSIAHAFLKGVTLFRVHDVGATGDFLKVMAAIG